MRFLISGEVLGGAGMPDLEDGGRSGEAWGNGGACWVRIREMEHSLSSFLCIFQYFFLVKSLFAVKFSLILEQKMSKFGRKRSKILHQ